MNTECHLFESPNGYVCTVCRKPARVMYRRRCRLAIVATALCPMNAIVSRLTSAGVARLQRCREAHCGMMLPVEGSIRCVGMPGSKCQWIAAWADRLNGEWVCPHWLPVVPPSGCPTEGVDHDANN